MLEDPSSQHTDTKASMAFDLLEEHGYRSKDGIGHEEIIQVNVKTVERENTNIRITGSLVNE